MQILLLTISIVGLYFGAEFALDASEKVGKRFGLPPLVIGLVLIGFGTSLPELFVSQLASFRGQGGIALGNIIGSNVANSFLILGISSLIVPLSLASSELRPQFIFHFIVHLMIVIFFQFFGISPISSLFLILFFVIYISFTLITQKHEDEDESETENLNFMVYAKLFLGFALLYASGELLVSSGSELGGIIGISPFVISAIFVAFGTSFPELVTAILACKKKKDTDLIVGNILGSNIFNISLVLGSIGFYNIETESRFLYESSILMFFCLITFALFKFKKSLNRLTGLIFLSIYLGSVYYWLTK
ncbi:MAG: calcium/sodium antiporter [Bacteriovoracaceae bacterium]